MLIIPCKGDWFKKNYIYLIIYFFIAMQSILYVQQYLKMDLFRRYKTITILSWSKIYFVAGNIWSIHIIKNIWNWEISYSKRWTQIDD